jgi:hypothetical protein
VAGKSFAEGIAELNELVGDGRLQGTVEVDQVYAQYQHEALDLVHPRGGHARYLADPLNGKYREYYQRIAEETLHTGPAQAMADAMEDLADQVTENAPVQFGNLRESAHPIVTSDGETVFDRPPVQRRLTEKELAEQRRTGVRHRVLHPEQYQ